MPPRLAITLGDVTGVGPEVTLKALAAEAANDETRYLLVGDSRWARRLNEQLRVNLPLTEFTDWNAPGRFFLLDPLSSVPHEPPPLPACGHPLPRSERGRGQGEGALRGSGVQSASFGSENSLPAELPPGSPLAANAAIASLTEAGRRCLAGELAGMVTAPVNKANIIRAGHKFIGQTEFLSELAGAKRTAMMLLGQDAAGCWLRVALVTIHVPLQRVAELITPERITLAIELAAQSCRDLGLPRARIAVCGLNPHAGESGEIGDEELTIIEPTVRAARQRGLDVIGPLSGDTVFHHALHGEFDTVVAMYHDQGLAPLKAVAFDTGVNWTLGLPFIRTSPDHGTAYDIAGRGIANPSSMIAAIRLAKQLAKRSA